jgi:IS605 OrfB family transposase
MLDQKLSGYVKNLPLHPMPFHNQSVWIEKIEKDKFFIHFKTKQEENEAVCCLAVPQKYRSLIEEASGQDNPTLGQVELVEDNEYAYFNVHITLRLPQPEPYEPDGWIGVDVGWNCLAVSAYINKATISDVTFHGKTFKHRIIQLKYLLKQYQRSNRSWKKWNHHLKNVITYTTGKIAKEIVEKAEKHHAGIALENLSFQSHTKRFLIPRYKLKYAVQNLSARKGIPFTFVNPSNTSQTCNRCGYTARNNRNGENFQCQKCGYQANADYNAAVNIAKKAILHQATSLLQKPIQPCAEKVGEVSTPSGLYAPEASMNLIKGRGKSTDY